MEAQDLVSFRLSNLITRIPYLRCRYEWIDAADTHLIEVLPSRAYHLNDEYREIESEITQEFLSRYPNENICFITEGSAITIEGEYKTFEGRAWYKPFIPFADILPSIGGFPTFCGNQVENLLGKRYVGQFESISVTFLETTYTAITTIQPLRIRDIPTSAPLPIAA